MDISLPDNEAKRLAALREHHILDTPPAEEFDDLVQLAAQVCGVSIAAITLIDEHRQWFKAMVGIQVTEIPRDISFCAHTILQPDLLVIPDARADHRFASYPQVTGDAHIRFYAGAPLITEDGHALGSLCILDRMPRELTPEQEATLRLLARQAASHLRAGRRFAERERLVSEREQAEYALQQSNQALKVGAARLVEAQRIGRIGDWHLDIATQRFTWSAEVFRLMEFDPAKSEPCFEDVLLRYHPDDRAVRDALFAQALATGEFYQCDIRLVLPSGTPRWCHLIGQPEKDDSGKVVRVSGTVMDSTERMEREQQVLEANVVLEIQKAQLEAANAELEGLATTDPLTGLLNHRTFQTRLAEEAARVQRQSTVLAVIMLDLDNFKFFNDVYGHSTGDAVLCQVAERLRQVCRPYDVVARFGGDEFALLLPDVGSVTEAELTARLRVDLAGLVFCPTGTEAIPINLSVGTALFTIPSTDYHETLRQADERLLRSKTGGGGEVEADRIRAHAGKSLQGFSMLDALVVAVDNKDRYTRRHSEDVMEYSLMIARALKLDKAALQTVGVAALLHDVGKIGVPDAILRKPGRLTEQEFEAVRQHPVMGAVIVGAVKGLEETLDAVRHHHERWDGAGYPAGLRGCATPMIARLMAVADAFSAMTTDRPYRKGMEREKALSILEEGAGTQWDPACVQAFVQALVHRYEEAK